MNRLFTSVLLLLIVSCSPLRKYQDLPEVQAWNKDITLFENLDKEESYPSDAILFTGSSSIRLWTTLPSDMAPYHVIQRGYGGAKLSDFAVYASRIIDPHPCSAIVIFVANDISGTKEDKSPEEVAQLFKNVLKTIRKTHQNTPVFWIAITPSPLRWKVWPGISKANGLIENICKNQSNTYFVRTDFAFLNNEGFPREEYFKPDKLHLNPEGYQIWTRIIKDQLNKVVPVTVSEGDSK
jgi:lysophospholipase L1-like esterase